MLLCYFKFMLFLDSIRDRELGNVEGQRSIFHGT